MSKGRLSFKTILTKKSIISTAAVVFFLLSFFAVHQILSSSSKDIHDLTFFLAGDTHYGLSEKTASSNQAIIDSMNSLPGTPYPEGTIPGAVKNPLGVIVVGDLVEEGEGELGAKQWEEFTRDFGVDGEGRIDFPVYEGFGNHDGGAEHPIRRGIKLRNLHRPGVSHISKNGYHYSWNWKGIHFIQLNLFPGTKADRIINPWGGYFEGSWKEPLHSLEFLREDLKKQAKDKEQPVIILMHYGFDPYGLGWWAEREREVFYEAIKDYRILAIFWGHTHMVQSIKWHGVPTFCAGSTQKSNGPGEFLVVHITYNTMYVLERKLNRWGVFYKVQFSK